MVSLLGTTIGRSGEKSLGEALGFCGVSSRNRFAKATIFLVDDSWDRIRRAPGSEDDRHSADTR
jgi:hypothetical protein